MQRQGFISFIFFLMLAFGLKPLHAQSSHDSDLVQFTGFVVNNDSSKTIPYVTIRIVGTNRGTYSDMQGFFSFVAKRSDLILFTCLGYEPKYFRFPSESKGNKVKSVVALKLDSFLMEEVVIIGRPTAEQMDYMFARVRLPGDELAIAQQNLRSKPLMDQSNALDFNAYDNARLRFSDYANRAYYAGQAQPIPVMDVMAWSKFLDALQKGKLKRK